MLCVGAGHGGDVGVVLPDCSPSSGPRVKAAFGRNVNAPPGHVLLAATYDKNRDRLGRTNMSVFSLDKSSGASRYWLI